MFVKILPAEGRGRDLLCQRQVLSGGDQADAVPDQPEEQTVSHQVNTSHNPLRLHVERSEGNNRCDQSRGAPINQPRFP